MEILKHTGVELQHLSDFPPFCYANIRVTGDSKVFTGARHPLAVCRECLLMHASSSLTGGKLFVRCPAEGCSP